MSEPRPMPASDTDIRALRRLRDRVIEATRNLGQMTGYDAEQALKELKEEVEREDL